MGCCCCRCCSSFVCRESCLVSWLPQHREGAGALCCDGRGLTQRVASLVLIFVSQRSSGEPRPPLPNKHSLNSHVDVKHGCICVCVCVCCFLCGSVRRVHPCLSVVHLSFLVLAMPGIGRRPWASLWADLCRRADYLRAVVVVHDSRPTTKFPSAKKRSHYLHTRARGGGGVGGGEGIPERVQQYTLSTSTDYIGYK